MSPKHPIVSLLLAFVALAALLAGCRANPAPAPATPQLPTETLPAPPVATTVAPTATPTPEPLALEVNGEGVTVAEYEAELRQLQEALSALGQTRTDAEQRQLVLDNLTDTLLLAQGAQESGFTVDEAALQAEAQRLGGQDWRTRYGYSESAFQKTLERQMAAAWQRDQIAAGVPAVAEQIHARQILALEEDIARRALEQVKIPGVNFAAQAYRYDLVTGGDLGWFPRGYLTQPEVEAAAFLLQPGEISPVVQSKIGYHIIQVISREPARPLSPDALRVLQHKAVEEWLRARREASQVQVLLP